MMAGTNEQEAEFGLSFGVSVSLDMRGLTENQTRLRNGCCLAGMPRYLSGGGRRRRSCWSCNGSSFSVPRMYGGTLIHNTIWWRGLSYLHVRSVGSISSLASNFSKTRLHPGSLDRPFRFLPLWSCSALVILGCPKLGHRDRNKRATILSFLASFFNFTTEFTNATITRFRAPRSFRLISSC